MKLRYTFRFYPTAGQGRVLARVFGACRYVYNWGLRLQTDAYREHDDSLRYDEPSALHARIADARADTLHKITTDLVERFDAIAIEDLSVRGRSKNHALARALSSAVLGEFRQMLEYKCAGYGRELRKVDRFYPSSKRCSQCGLVLEQLPLGCRQWTCPHCGEEQDRDTNAAKNILAAGHAVTARGRKVRRRRGRIR